MARTIALYLICLLSLGGALRAQEAENTPEQEARLQQARQLVDSLNYRSGKVVLPGSVAALEVNQNFQFLDQRDSETVLTKVWGNPPDSEVLGMVVPKGVSVLSPGIWAAVITYDKSGYVKDGEARTLDYNQLLKQMQEQTAAANEERAKAGYPTAMLLNWAETPHYDAANHKLYWAKQIRFQGESVDTLNYCIRALGRDGVLELNIISPISELPQVKQAAPGILSMIDFQAGHRYTDFNSSTDKVAKYGIGALIAGGVLAKVGFFKGLFVAILALKKFVIIGLVAVASGLRKFFAWISGRNDRRQV